MDRGSDLKHPTPPDKIMVNVYESYNGYLRDSLRRVRRSSGQRTIYVATVFGVTGLVLSDGEDEAREQSLSALDGGPSPERGTVLRDTGRYVTREQFEDLWLVVPDATRAATTQEK